MPEVICKYEKVFSDYHDTLWPYWEEVSLNNVSLNSSELNEVQQCSSFSTEDNQFVIVLII